MKCTLRKIIETIDQNHMLETMPDIKPGLATALGSFSISADEKTTATLFDREHIFEDSAVDLTNHPIDMREEIWVEMMSSVHLLPLIGRVPGSHVLYGSAINPCPVVSGLVCDMFLFMAIVDAEPSNGHLIVDQVRSVSASPLQVRLSQTHAGSPPVFQYKTIGQVKTRALAQQLVKRDLTFHKLTLAFLYEGDRVKSTKAAALDGLPEWLREPSL